MMYAGDEDYDDEITSGRYDADMEPPYDRIPGEPDTDGDDDG
jgi:hypothetical protein